MSIQEGIKTPSLLINWSMSSPALEPKAWHQWSENLETLMHQDLEISLEWPLGTISALEQAFEKHLSRSIGWQIPARFEDPLRQAALVFRRGVAASGQKQVTVSGAYPVHFPNNFEPHRILDLNGPALIDENVATLWRLDPRPMDLVLTLDEAHKSLQTVAIIKTWIKTHPGPVTIIGGGILADTGAFAAALLGRTFRLIPTTLLAMVDACVGGKTGVNFGKFGKNQLGLFAFPTEVVIAGSWLTTLKNREFKAGLAEAYKHALIKGDPSLAKSVATCLHTAKAIQPHLHALVAVKANIIHEDPNETGKRAVLNFGHTLAHALENISHTYNPQDPLLHGEAIGIGMLFALYLSQKLGFLAANTFTTITSELRASSFLIAIPTAINHLAFTQFTQAKLIEMIVEGVMQDKKNQDAGATEWVLLKDWGECVQTGSLFTVSVPHDVLRIHLETFLRKSGLKGQA
ncbi:MAG: 3-dehydroquinate synthase [Chitinophagaceae bacterium]|nr:3-dehydroquinate synthase [Oligoflexus sp.]